MLFNSKWDSSRVRQVQSNSLTMLSKRAVAQKARTLRVLNSDRQKHLINQVLEILKQGAPTVFCFEGACRRGLRSSLCLQGWSWDAADFAAAQIVSRALARLGAERPNWQQGQPEWTQDGFSPIERTRCIYCGGVIPPEKIARSVIAEVKYCSDQCGNIHRLNRHSLMGHAMNRAEYLAAQAAAREKRKVACAACGKRFLPGQVHDGNMYCSKECFGTVNRKLVDRPCDQCGMIFRPRERSRRFCSRDCHYANKRLSKRNCEFCGNEYQPKASTSRLCSLSCNANWRHDRDRAAAQSGFLCEAAE